MLIKTAEQTNKCVGIGAGYIWTEIKFEDGTEADMLSAKACKEFLD